MKTINTNTGMLQLIDVAMYHGICSPDNLIDEYMLSEDLEEGYGLDYGINDTDDYWSKFDFEKYKQWILKHAKLFISLEVLPEIKELNIGILDIEFIRIHSPREYNFSNDVLIFDLVVEDEFEENLVDYLHSLPPEELEELAAHLRDTCTSVSGFVSFVPNHISDFTEAIADGDSKSISVFLQWLFYKKLEVYKGYDDDPMDKWYQYIQETQCNFYEFINK